MHELGFAECSKSWIFRGTKEVTPQKVAEQRNLKKRQQPQQQGLQPLQEQGGGGRVLSGSCAGQGGRIILLTGGPCTEGAGLVVGKPNEEAMRSHKDLAKDSAPHFRKACKYYETLSQQLVSQNHTLDIFACALDQCGLAEMKVCVERTSGHMVLAESFNHEVFKKSFQRIFTFTDSETSRSMGIAFNGLFEVYTSRDVKARIHVAIIITDILLLSFVWEYLLLSCSCVSCLFYHIQKGSVKVQSRS